MRNSKLPAVDLAPPRSAIGEQAVELLTPNDLARQWGVAKSFIYFKVTQGQLEAIRIGRYVRFTPDAVRRFVEQQQERAR